MSAAFGWEPLCKMIYDPALAGLLREQHEELGHFRDRVPVALDVDRMMELERLDIFRVWAARSDDLLIGFITFFIQPHLFHCNTKFAVAGEHYLDPVFRGNDWTGQRMWSSAKLALKEIGVQVAVAPDNDLHPLGPFFRRLGFERQGSCYWIWLGDD